MKLSSMEVVLTATGRRTTPFPPVRVSTTRQASSTLRAVDRWLISNAVAEACARGDDYNERQFQCGMAKPTQADKDSAELYLFEPPTWATR